MDVTLSRHAEIDRATAEASRDAPWLVPVLREVRAGRLALIQPTRTGLVSMGRLKRMILPALIVLGDDDYCGTGPDGWASASRVIG